MDRSLRISVLLQAGDRASRPLRDIANGGSRAAEALKAARDKLKQLNTEQGDIDGFRRLRAGLRETDQALGTAQARVAQLTREMDQAARPTRDTKRDLAAAKREVESLTRQQQKSGQQLGELGTRLRTAGVDTNRLSQRNRELRGTIDQVNGELAEQTRRFEQASDRQRRFGAARDRFARTQGIATGMAAGGAAAIGTGVAMGTGIWQGVKAAQEYQSAMTDIAQKANLSRVEANRMGAGLLVAAKAANQMPADLQAGVDTLSGFGLDPRKAVAMMTPIGRAATAYKAEIADLSAAAFAANDNLKVPIEQTARVIDIMAQAGKSGAFEIKDMAGAFPSLTAGYQALGQTGTGAVADLAAALQIARKGAGDSASAAGNISNVIQKISSPATIKAFSKFGIDLPKALKKAYAEGKTPLEAIAELTKKATGGDLGKIGFFFEDAQVQQGLRPLIQNMEEYRRIRAEASGASGVTDTDFAERLKDSAEQSKQLEINAKALGITMGSLLLPTVNALTARASAFANTVADLAARHPRLAKAVGIGALALAGLFVVLGGGAIALAGLMMPIAIINSGLVAMGVSGGLASVGLMPILGTVALVTAGVVALAAAAWLIYKHWGAITGFFRGLWADVTAGFFGGVAGIAATFVNFSPLGLLYMAFAPAFRWLGFDVPARFSTFGRNMIAGLIGGIMGMLGRLKDTIVGAASSAAAWFKARLGIRSPSRVFAGFGGYMMQGLDGGIADGQAAPIRRVDRLSRRITAAMAAGAAASVATVPASADPVATGQTAPIARIEDLSRQITAAMAIGATSRAAAAPAIASAAGGRDPIGARPAPASYTAAPISVSITINPPSGASATDIAAAVREEIEKLRRGPPPGSSSTFADPPDWI